MKIYVVATHYEFEGYGEPEAAFTSREEAEAYVAQAHQDTYTTPEIFEFTV